MLSSVSSEVILIYNLRIKHTVCFQHIVHGNEMYPVDQYLFSNKQLLSTIYPVD